MPQSQETCRFKFAVRSVRKRAAKPVFFILYTRNVCPVPDIACAQVKPARFLTFW